MEILGHSQIAVTMNIYAHVVQDTQPEAVSHLDRTPKAPSRDRLGAFVLVGADGFEPPTSAL
jgi:hypothetical protein